MEIAVVAEGITPRWLECQAWNRFRGPLARRGIAIQTFGRWSDAFRRPFDAMLLHVWQDWENRERFAAHSILPLMAEYAAYRAAFSETIQIVFNHTDMSRPPYATPYWRPGDPVLYRTPAYERGELWPFPPDRIWAYEQSWGRACFRTTGAQRHAVGFIGRPSGPVGYRERVAREVAKVGVGICEAGHAYARAEYDEIMSACRIVVCPRGWGEQSQRHWDAWLSGKPVLTDRACDSVEMIPGLRLREGVHYLVFDDAREIPDIVLDWTRPSRLDDLAAIAENGRAAARSYDAFERITAFFSWAVDPARSGLPPLTEPGESGGAPAGMRATGDSAGSGGILHADSVR